MFKKYKYLLLIFTSFLLFSALIRPVLALEVSYPTLPGGYTLGPSNNLSTYIIYVFIFLVVSVGTIGIIAIVYSGFKILMSFGNPAEIGNARSRILSCVLGIILLLFSYVILDTINPELTNITTTLEPPSAGVFFRKTNALSSTGYDYIQAADDIYDTGSIKLPGGLPVELWYWCDTPSANLLVWLYEKVKMERNDHETTVSVKCNDFITIDPIWKSLEWRYEQPGVYFYQTDNCIGYASDVQKSSRNLTFYYTPHVKSVRIVNGRRKDERYGVILTNQSGGEGECTEPIMGGFPGYLPGATSTTPGAPGDSCYEVSKDLSGGDFESYFAHIIKFNPNYLSDGGQVDLNSENIFARFKPTDSVEPRFDIGPLYIADEEPPPDEGTPPDEKIKHHNVRLESLIRDQFEFDYMLYTEGAREDECCIYEGAQNEKGWDLGCKGTDPAISEWPNTCLKSIDIIGNFYVVLYSKSEKQKGAVCEIILRSFDTLTSGSELFNYDRELYKLVIIPQGG